MQQAGSNAAVKAPCSAVRVPAWMKHLLLRSRVCGLVQADGYIMFMAGDMTPTHMLWL